MNEPCLSLGAIALAGGGVAFRLWAPRVELVEVQVVGAKERRLPLQREAGGYHAAVFEDLAAGTDYLYRLDGGEARPDPASRWQPSGVHGPSRVVPEKFPWEDRAWRGLSLRQAVLYELHIGTFTAEGTFEAAARDFPRLQELGITAVELMPVAQFPGARNWGYDGVFPFAVQHSYGGPEGLKKLVNEAHACGLAVVLDVVYNHLGPEGNYLGHYGPYFTDTYRTPWGDAINFDGPHSDEVRRYFIENALHWQTEYHADALRLDAVHAIRDFSPVPFLEELGEVVRKQAQSLGRPCHLIAESDRNMARHILPRSLGGYGLDAQWSDDFHHALHVLLTGEQRGYYADFTGVAMLAKAWREGYAYTGEYSAYREHRHGSSPRLNPVKQFVVCAQNHDLVGNRMLGDRLSATLPPEDLRLAAAAVLLSPFVPLLFMGEEYGETAPFQYFVSHGDPTLVEAVRKGRREEFASFAWQGTVPDPQSEGTFLRSKLNRALLEQPPHLQLQQFHRECLRLRSKIPALAWVEKETMTVQCWEPESVLMARAWAADGEVLILLHFGRKDAELRLSLPRGRWHCELDSRLVRWGGAEEDFAPDWDVEGAMKYRMAPRSAVLWRRLEGEG